jgi:hypothetical protein
MTYWDGTRWVPDSPTTAPSRTSRGRRFFEAAAEAGLISALMFGLIAGSTLAAKGGQGNGQGPHNAYAAASCAADGTTVSASGLPTDEVINFMVTDPSGTWSWVLGWSDDGTRTVTVPVRTGATTYEFVSRTFGNDGSRYEVFATCSAEA